MGPSEINEYYDIVMHFWTIRCYYNPSCWPGYRGDCQYLAFDPYSSFPLPASPSAKHAYVDKHTGRKEKKMRETNFCIISLRKYNKNQWIPSLNIFCSKTHYQHKPLANWEGKICFSTTGMALSPISLFTVKLFGLALPPITENFIISDGTICLKRTT